jgi:hypothetical protein
MIPHVVCFTAAAASPTANGNAALTTIMAARSVSGVRRVVQPPQRFILCVGGRDLTRASC